MVLRWFGHWNGGIPPDALATHVGRVGSLDPHSLDPLVQGVVLLGLTVLVGALVVGLLPGYGNRVLRTTQRSPVISLCIGVPLASVLASLTYIGHLLSASSIGVFFAIPLLAVCLTPLVVWSAVGFVALGGFIARRLGVERSWVWALVGGVLCGSIAISLPVGAVALALAASLGVGAGARVAFTSGASTDPDERVVPPANKV